MLAARSKMSLAVVLGCVLMGGAARTSAQSAAPEPEGASRANEAFLAKDWATASAAYAALIRSSPESGLFHFRLGATLVHLGRPAEALPLLDKAEALGWPAAQVAFRKACAQARLGHQDAAFEELDRAARSGFGLVSLLESDEHLASLRA